METHMHRQVGGNGSFRPPGYEAFPPPEYDAFRPSRGAACAVDVPRPPLRPSRSTTYLRNAAHQHQHQHQHQRPQTRGGVANGNGMGSRKPLPAGFMDEDVPPMPHLLSTPTTAASSSLLTTPEIRRVKSSSALDTASSSDSSGTKQTISWKKALGDAQYAVGGLISRPAVSTKHYSIIRHSHGLVWYRGPSTSISITILSDAPLPPARTVWLQEKGYSGNMGMSLKALVGSTGSWLDVTPARQAWPEHVPEADERSIQRDLKKFVKKASGNSAKHVPRETHVVRIPAAAADGYFRLVLCCGEGSKKVLCGSPPFRIASTSSDIAVVRGASLSTMPLEVGVKVASTIGQQVAKKYTGIAGAVVQSRAKKVVVNATVKKASQAAYRGYHSTGLNATLNESWDRSRAGGYDPILGGAAADASIGVFGPDDGPEAPFPLKFEGKVAQGTGASTEEVCIPTANLREVPQDIKARLHGVYAAWARVVPEPGLEGISQDWHESIVTIAPLWNAAPGITMKNRVVVHMIHDFEGASFLGARIKVLLVGYLHPPLAVDVDLAQLMSIHAEDAMMTVTSLGREAWAPEEIIARMKGVKMERSMSNHLDAVTGRVQQGVGRIPLHWAGVRSEAGAMRDAVHGNGGMWIAR